MPQISKPQILAFKIGKYKDFSTNTLTSFTAIPTATLLSAGGINLNGNPGITYNANQFFSNAASANNFSTANTIINPADPTLPDVTYHEYGYSSNVRHNIAYCGVNINRLAKRIKSGYCNLTFIGDSLLVPENNYLWESIYAAWYPDKWRGVVTDTETAGGSNTPKASFDFSGASGATDASRLLFWGVLNRYTPPGYPLIKPNSTGTDDNTANALTRVVTSATNNLYTESEAKFTHVVGTSMRAFLKQVDGNTVTAIASPTSGTGVALYPLSPVSTQTENARVLHAGYIKGIPTYFNASEGKYLHSTSNLDTLDSFFRGTTQQAIECKALIPVGKKTDSFSKYHLAVYNGKGVTGPNNSWNTVYTNNSNDGSPGVNWFMLNYLYAGTYQNNAAYTTFDFSTTTDFSINIVNIGSLDQNNEADANCTTPLCWFVYLEGSNSVTDISGAPKLFITPKMRFHNKLATTGLQLGRFGFAGAATSNFVGTSAAITSSLGVSNLPSASYGEIPVQTMAKYFEFEGTNTVMVHMGTNDGSVDNLDSDVTVANFTRLINRITEAWNIAKANNSECVRDGDLLINFIIPVTTGTTNTTNVNNYLNALFTKMLPLLTANKNLSIISMNEVLNKGFMNNATDEFDGQFFVGSGGYSNTAQEGIDVDITGTTLRYFAGDAANVHPTGIGSNWASTTTLDDSPAYRFMRGMWNLITMATSNDLKAFTTDSFENISKVGGSLVPCDGVAGYAQLTAVDRNYHKTGLMFYKKK